MRNHGMAEVRQSECREHSLVYADVRTGAPHTPALIASEGRAAQFGVQRRLGLDFWRAQRRVDRVWGRTKLTA